MKPIINLFILATLLQTHSLHAEDAVEQCLGHLDQVEVGYRCLLLGTEECNAAYETVYKDKKELTGQAELLPASPNYSAKFRLPDETKTIDWRGEIKKRGIYSILSYGVSYAIQRVSALYGGAVTWFFYEPFWGYLGMGSNLDPCEDFRGTVGHYMPLDKADCKTVGPEFSKELYSLIRKPRAEREEFLKEALAREGAPREGKIPTAAFCPYVKTLADRFQEKAKKFSESAACDTHGSRPALKIGAKKILFNSDKSISLGQYGGRGGNFVTVPLDNGLNLVRPMILEKARSCGFEI